MAERSRDEAPAFDPFAEIEASPRGATPLAALAAVLGVLAAISGLAAILGPIGMAVGLVAHVKGSRFGMPATVLAAVGMVVGFSLAMYLR